MSVVWTHLPWSSVARSSERVPDLVIPRESMYDVFAAVKDKAPAKANLKPSL